jgi:maltose/maltodextrin transport system substrate-binding protein
VGGCRHPAIGEPGACAAPDDIDPLGWQGFGLRGRLWGYPYALEAVTLLYNKALVKTPPRSFDEVIALDDQLARQGKRAIIWDYTNTYFTWPLLAAQGGYAFKQRADGSYDPRDTGVANAGAKQGAELLARLIKEGRMPVGSGYAEMEAAVAQGRVAMMINGPWAWVNLKRMGIDFGVARIPAVAGKPAAPFVGVKGLLINRATRQRELAVEFIEHHVLTLPKACATSTAPNPSAHRPAAPTTPNCWPTRPMARVWPASWNRRSTASPRPATPRWAASGPR